MGPLEGLIILVLAASPQSGGGLTAVGPLELESCKAGISNAMKAPGSKYIRGWCLGADDDDVLYDSKGNADGISK